MDDDDDDDDEEEEADDSSGDGLLQACDGASPTFWRLIFFRSYGSKTCRHGPMVMPRHWDWWFRKFTIESQIRNYPMLFQWKSETKVDFTLNNWWICTVAGGWLEAFDSERTINRYIARGCQFANLTNCSFFAKVTKILFPVRLADRPSFWWKKRNITVDKSSIFGQFEPSSPWFWICLGLRRLTHIRQNFVGMLRTPLKPLMFVFATELAAQKIWVDIMMWHLIGKTTLLL